MKFYNKIAAYLLTIMVFNTFWVSADGSHLPTINVNYDKINICVTPYEINGVESVTMQVLNFDKNVVVYTDETDENKDGVFIFNEFSLSDDNDSGKYIVRTGGDNLTPLDTEIEYISKKDMINMVSDVQGILTISKNDEISQIINKYNYIFKLDLNTYNLLNDSQLNFCHNLIKAQLSENLTPPQCDKLVKSSVLYASFCFTKNAYEVKNILEIHNDILNFDDEFYKKAVNKDLIANKVVEFDFLEMSVDEIKRKFDEISLIVSVSTVDKNSTAEILTHYENKNLITLDKTYSKTFSASKTVEFYEKLKESNSKNINELETNYLKISKQLFESNSNNNDSGSRPPSGGGGTSVGVNGNKTPIATPTPTPTEREYIFKDVNKDFWASEAIYNLYDLKFISGYDNYFYPNDNIKREEFTKIIVTAFNLKSENPKIIFDDVSENEWYYNYIAIAENLGIIKGKSAVEFGIGESLTREDMAVIISRVLDYKKTVYKEKEKPLFLDNEDISTYATKAVYELYRCDIVSGMGDNMFFPKNYATKAQCVTIINNLLNKG